jgi:EAL domain-containing protein (putative c-di-GMP-specific phosphodiesterase class I)
VALAEDGPRLRPVDAVDRVRFTMHFQPIVDVRARKVFAYEALCRPQDERFKSPQDLIEAAVRAGRVGELGRLQRSVAVKKCSGWPLFLNIEPNEFNHGWLVRPDDPVFRHRWPVYLEITENVPLKFFEQCHSVLSELRKKGVLLAIDDLGAGFSNLKYIAELEPDIVKLDRDLVAGVRYGTREFGLLESIARLCHEMGARVVSEGVETPEEFEAVARAEVDYCQGYLLARPAAAPSEVKWADFDSFDAGTRGESSAADGDVGGPWVAAGEGALDSSSEAAVRALRQQLERAQRSLDESEKNRKYMLYQLRLLSAEDESELPEEDEPEPTPVPAAGVGRSDSVASLRLPGLDRVRPRFVALAAALLVFGFSAVLALLRDSSPPAFTGADASVRTGRPATRLAALNRGRRLRTAVASRKAASLPPEPAIEVSEVPEPVPPSVVDLDPKAEIESRIADWARAWAEHRSEDYLGFYAEGFEPPEGLSRGEWEAQRRVRVGRPGALLIAVDGTAIELRDADSARASFVQSYESATYSDRVMKTLELVREDGEWRIAAERAVELVASGA